MPNATQTKVKPPKGIARPDPFAAADKIDRRLGAAPFTANASPVIAPRDELAQAMVTPGNTPRDTATQDNASGVKATHGNRVRVTAYMSIADAASVQAMATSNDRSDSYIAGQLIAEALAARRAAAGGAQ
jgi:hypothetical protein